MSRVWRNIAAVGVAIVVPLGFYAYFSVKLLTQIAVSVFSIKIKSVGAGFIDLVLTLRVENPANVGVSIEGYDMKIKINGADVADIKNTTSKKLESKAVSYLDIPITIKYPEFASKVKFNEILQYLLLSKFEKISLTLDGAILGSVAKVPVATSIKATLTMRDIMDKKDPKFDIGKIKFF